MGNIKRFVLPALVAIFIFNTFASKRPRDITVLKDSGGRAVNGGIAGSVFV